MNRNQITRINQSNVEFEISNGEMMEIEDLENGEEKLPRSLIDKTELGKANHIHRKRYMNRPQTYNDQWYNMNSNAKTIHAQAIEKCEEV